MRLSATTIVIAIIALLGTSAAAVSSEPASGVVRGAVADASGGVLPGVTVVATAEDGRVLATAVTDEAGSFVIGALRAGPVHLSFELEGFASGDAGLAIQAGVESLVEQRLALASMKETVVVYGKAPVEPPPPPPMPLAPVVNPLPIHDRESVCGPAKRAASSESFGTIRSHRYESDRELYSKEDQLVIDGGTETGLDVGQNLVARRYYRANTNVVGEHTAGVVQIVAADEHTATAVVVYACDELRKGDFLASFNPEPLRAPDSAGIPDFDDAAQILFADAGQMLGVPRRLMVINQGGDAGIRVGQRLTLFRQKSGHGGGKRTIVGDASVVAIRSDSATIRVERANDVIAFGDWAAPQRSAASEKPTTQNGSFREP